MGETKKRPTILGVPCKAHGGYRLVAKTAIGNIAILETFEYGEWDLYWWPKKSRGVGFNIELGVRGTEHDAAARAEKILHGIIRAAKLAEARR